MIGIDFKGSLQGIDLKFITCLISLKI